MIYEKTKQISFPLGGIGSGSIGLSGDGSLIDWEIWNRPSKSKGNGYSHFALKVTDNGQSTVKILQGDTNEPLSGEHDYRGGYCGFGFGVHTGTMAGLPHFKDVTFDGAFPVARIRFSEDGFPVVATLRAWNPLIPQEEDDSSLPAAFFEWELENRSERTLSCALSFTVQNPANCSKNQALEVDGHRGLFFFDAGHTVDQIEYCDLCMATDCADATVQSNWYRGEFMDSVTTFWNQLCKCDRMPEREYETAGNHDHGSLVSYVTLSAGEKRTIRFVLAWNVPNQYNYWNPCRDENGNDITWKNYYATLFETSRETAAYALRRFSALSEQTQRFADTLWQSDLPSEVLDAISANLSVLKSPTVLRLTDGSLWGWEGCCANEGSCEGSCQHVWNYAYALPFLFPRLERSLRENTLKYALYPSGETAFRIPLPPGRSPGRFRACVDGQMGEIIKCYREWKLSGDDAWIRQHADDIFRMLEYAWSEENPDRWDADRDGVITGRQHHTLDKELFGANAWLEGFYLLALDCGAQIADAVGDAERAAQYRDLYDRGRAWTNESLFNGSWFYQQVDLRDRTLLDVFGATEYWNEETGEIKYQIGDGCIIDQMLADWHAAILGCNGVFDTEKKRRALQSLYRNNYQTSMRSVVNLWRNFALNDEGGTIICSYPDGASKPAIPIPYCEECMTGFEYALAGLMIANGYEAEGESLVRSVRERYDGEKRNPWNEIECGSHYARSMASFALMPIYSGLAFDMPRRFIGFYPRHTGAFLWSVGDTWGRIRTSEKSHCLTVYGRPLVLSAYGLEKGTSVRSVRIDGHETAFAHRDGCICFADLATIREALEIELR